MAAITPVSISTVQTGNVPAGPIGRMTRPYMEAQPVRLGFVAGDRLFVSEWVPPEGNIPAELAWSESPSAPSPGLDPAYAGRPMAYGTENFDSDVAVLMGGPFDSPLTALDLNHPLTSSWDAAYEVDGSDPSSGYHGGNTFMYGVYPLEITGWSGIAVSGYYGDDGAWYSGFAVHRYVSQHVAWGFDFPWFGGDGVTYFPFVDKTNAAGTDEQVIASAAIGNDIAVVSGAGRYSDFHVLTRTPVGSPFASGYALPDILHAKKNLPLFSGEVVGGDYIVSATDKFYVAVRTDKDEAGPWRSAILSTDDLGDTWAVFAADTAFNSLLPGCRVGGPMAYAPDNDCLVVSLYTVASGDNPAAIAWKVGAGAWESLVFPRPLRDIHALGDSKFFLSSGIVSGDPTSAMLFLLDLAGEPPEPTAFWTNFHQAFETI